MAQIDDVIAQLRLDTSNFQRSVQAAEGQLRTGTGRMGQDVERLGSRFTSFSSTATQALGVLGVALSVRAVAGFAQGIIDAGDELQKMSVRTGVTVENLSALKLSAELSGSSLQELGNSLRFMQVNVAEAARGTGEAEKVLKAMGFTVDEMRRATSDPEGFLELFAQRLFRIQDAGGRTEAAFRVLGRSAQQQLPFLKDLADRGMAGVTEEAQRLNAVVSTDSARAAEAFNDNMKRIRTAADGLVRRVVEWYIPQLTRFLEMLGLVEKSAAQQRAAQEEALIQQRRRLEEQIAAGQLSPFRGLRMSDEEESRLRAQIDNITGQLKDLHQANVEAAKLELLATRGGEGPPIAFDPGAFEATKKQTDDATKEAKRLAKERADAVKSVVEESRTPLQEFEAELAKLEALRPDLPVEAFSLAVGKLSQELTQNDAGMQQFLQRQEEAARLTESLRTPLETFKASLAELDTLQPHLSIEAYGRAVAQLAQNFAETDEEFKRWNRSQEDGRRVIADNRTDLEVYNEEINRLVTLYQDTAISADQFATAQDRLRTKFIETHGVTRTLTSAVESMAGSFQGAFEDAILRASSFKDIMTALAEDMLRIAIRIFIVNNLIRGIAGGISAIAGSAGTGLGAPVSVAAPTIFDASGLQHGGLFSKPTLAMVAESGSPELVIPEQRMNTFLNDIAASMGGWGGGSVVTVSVINNAPNTKVSQQERQSSQGSRQIDVVIDEAVANQLSRTGSASSRSMRQIYGAGPVLTGR